MFWHVAFKKGCRPLIYGMSSNDMRGVFRARSRNVTTLPLYDIEIHKLKQQGEWENLILDEISSKTLHEYQIYMKHKTEVTITWFNETEST